MSISKQVDRAIQVVSRMFHNRKEEDQTMCFSEQIAKLRKQNRLTQEELANKLGITFQAVSKWENGLSYPDITLLPELADIFDCSIDALFERETKAEVVEKLIPVSVPETAPLGNKYEALPWEDDETLRVAVFMGHAYIGEKLDLTEHPEVGEYTFIYQSNEGKTPQNIICNLNLQCDCVTADNVSVGGNVNAETITGTLSAGGDVKADMITSAVSAGGNIECDQIGQQANAGGDIKADIIGGMASAGGSIEADEIQGLATAGCDIKAEQISGGANAGANIECGSIEGDVTAGTSICCTEIAGNAEAGTELKCQDGSIGGYATAGANLTCGGDIGGYAEAGGNITCGKAFANGSINCGIRKDASNSRPQPEDLGETISNAINTAMNAVFSNEFAKAFGGGFTGLSPEQEREIEREAERMGREAERQAEEEMRQHQAELDEITREAEERAREIEREVMEQYNADWQQKIIEQAKATASAAMAETEEKVREAQEKARAAMAEAEMRKAEGMRYGYPDNANGKQEPMKVLRRFTCGDYEGDLYFGNNGRIEAEGMQTVNIRMGDRAVIQTDTFSAVEASMGNNSTIEVDTIDGTVSLASGSVSADTIESLAMVNGTIEADTITTVYVAPGGCVKITAEDMPEVEYHNPNEA